MELFPFYHFMIVLLQPLLVGGDNLPFTNQQIEAQRCYMIFLRSHSWLTVPFAFQFSKALIPTPYPFLVYY